MADTPSLFPDDDRYSALLNDLKQRIRTAQVRAALAVNREMVVLYWQIGREILQRQQAEGWGGKVIQRLAQDLKREFPDVKGFSRSNLMYMRAFAEAWPDDAIVQQAAGQIPWFHNCTLLDKVKDPEARRWYIFLTIRKDARESELENALTYQIRNFLLELGMGFSFLGSQYPIEVSGKEYRLDLLFYHVHLHCYVVIDLKMGEFEPQHSGQMSFYVAAVDNLLRTDRDDPTIGIILCKSKDRTTVEYALQGSQQPIGVSSYKLRDNLPESLKQQLPTSEQLEMGLETAMQELERQEEE